jgi:hypothetical protein
MGSDKNIAKTIFKRVNASRSTPAVSWEEGMNLGCMTVGVSRLRQIAKDDANVIL